MVRQSIERDRQYEPSAPSLDRPIVVDPGIAGRHHHRAGLRPGRSFVVRQAHIGPAIQPGAGFNVVEERELAAGQTQEGNVHDIVAFPIVDHDAGRTPGTAAIIGVDLGDSCRTFIVGAAVKLREIKFDAARPEPDKGAFGVSGVFRTRLDVQDDLVASVILPGPDRGD